MKLFIKNLKKVYPFIKEDKWNILFYVVSILTLVAINVILPIFTAKLMINLTNNELYKLFIVALIIFLINLINIFFDNLLEKSYQKICKNSFTKMQIYISKEILKINNEQIDKNGTGLFVQRVTGDAKRLSSLMHRVFQFSCESLKNIGIFLAIFSINKFICIYLLITKLIEAWITKKKTQVVSKMDKKCREIEEKTVGFQNEFIRGIKDIKMLNAEESTIKKLNKDLSNLNNYRCKMNITQNNYYNLNDFYKQLFNFGLIALFIVLIYLKEIDAALALIAYNYSLQSSYIIEQFGWLSEYIEDFNLSAKRVFELADKNIFQQENFGIKKIKNITGNFEFKNVNFSYDKNKNILNKLSFKVEANTTVAFVGKSGQGKTTIFNLLCKMYDINEGEILIDGININELDKNSIRGNITIISQNPYLYNMSIKDDLKLVKHDLTEKEMKEACKMACLDEFINTLPDKYNTVIGEGGFTLSGGQKQRLAIARALIQKTKIILFDEATSALDSETQKKIQQAIDNMKNNYTIIIIAHRLSTIINCDNIMYLENGKIKAEGTHEELLKKSQDYKQLYEDENN